MRRKVLLLCCLFALGCAASNMECCSRACMQGMSRVKHVDANSCECEPVR